MKPLPALSTADILALRPAAIRPEPGNTPLDVISEVEAVDKTGRLADVLTVLLRGSECSFRCLMCDLWKSTHLTATLPGAIPAQIRHALERPVESEGRDGHAPARPRWIKLYNASNFFAPANVPTADLPAIAELVQGFTRVVVENHPRLRNDALLRFRDALTGRLEVAMGLETVHEPTLAALNKHMTVDDFCHACDWLHERDVDIRCFVLLRPPGMSEAEGIEWCVRSVEWAHRLGVRHISLIPLRSGNGAVEHLQAQGCAEAPRAASLEQVMRQVVGLSGSVITADLWDWPQLRGLTQRCREPRRLALERLNRSQRP